MAEEKQLDKIDIANELKTLSPLEKKSLELKAQAEAIEITDRVTYAEAKKVKRELISHRTSVKDLRLTFTRKLDNLKDQFIKKQDEVLEPSIAGETLIKERIDVWEKAEQERKAAEEKRIQDIIDRFAVKTMNTRVATLEDIRRARVTIKTERQLLEPNDRNRVAVKAAIDAHNAYLDDLETLVTERIEQERIAEEQRKEEERLAAERRKLEEEKTAQLAAERAEQSKSFTKPSLPTPLQPEGITQGSNPASPPSESPLEPGAPEADVKITSVDWELVISMSDPALNEEELHAISASILSGNFNGSIRRETK